MAKNTKATAPAAVIAGYSAKLGQHMMGHEGPAYWATIFRDGKQIGKAHDAGEGGSVDFYFDDPKEEEAYNAVAKRESTDFDFEQDSGFLAMLLDFASRAKNVAKWAAQGYSIFCEAYKWSDYVGGKFVPGSDANLLAFGAHGMGLANATQEERATAIWKALAKKGFDAARWVNADGSYGEWFHKPEPSEIKERPFSLTEA